MNRNAPHDGALRLSGELPLAARAASLVGSPIIAAAIEPTGTR